MRIYYLYDRNMKLAGGQMNESEEIVYQICKKSFLSLWSYANPIREDKKELCDILIVCDPDIIIFSVKKIKYKFNKGDSTGWERWIRKAINKSCDQIYGAERWVETADNVIRSDGQPGINIPPIDRQRILRIAIAFGGDEKVPLVYGDFGRGFIHFLDETSFDILLNELDTITDIVRYLISKEDLITSGIKLFNAGAEEDLLAFYLHNGRAFPRGYDAIEIDHTLWESLRQKEEFKRKKEADKTSYCWDAIINKIAEDALDRKLEYGNVLNNAEKSIRTMAQEDRFSRRILGSAFSEFYFTGAKKIRSRMTISPSKVVYVFLASPHGTDRRSRIAELGTRCFAARGKNPESHTVIGIATEEYEKDRGHSFDIYHLYHPTWNETDQALYDAMQEEMKYFMKQPEQTKAEDEYPKG